MSIGQNGNRLLDSNGSPKTLRHKFAVYCDDIAAGANTLEELYDLYEALLCCCFKAGIQVKASKVKFGVKECTFHNYTISEHGVKPKDANLCSIRNLTWNPHGRYSSPGVSRLCPTDGRILQRAANNLSPLTRLKTELEGFLQF